MIRTTTKTVNFKRPFTLAGHDGVFPAGTYTVETDEEPLDTATMIAYRRTRTLLNLQPRGNDRQTLAVDPETLDAAIKRDLEAVDSPLPAGATTRARHWP